MWIICSSCKKHKPLYKFSKGTKPINFGLNYECKDCHSKRAIKKRMKNKMWKQKQVMEIMNIRLSDLFDYELNGDPVKIISTTLDESDLEKMKRISEEIGSITNASILRMALRYMFIKIGY